MNMNIGRDQRVDSLGQSAVKLSEQVVYNMASLLQILGISDIRVILDQTMAGERPRVAELTFFNGVPPEIIRWADSAAGGIAELMSAFGVMGIHISADGENDMSVLEKAWESIVASNENKEEPVEEQAASDSSEVLVL